MQTFQNIFYLDIPYLTHKSMAGQAMNTIMLRPDFFDFMQKENAQLFEQFILFESSRILHKKGMDILTFEKIINCPIHPYMVKHIDFIERYENYALNDDYAQFNTVDKKAWEKFYHHTQFLYQHLDNTSIFFALLSEKKQNIYDEYRQLEHLFETFCNDSQAFEHFQSIADRFLSAFSMNSLSEMYNKEQYNRLFEHLLATNHNNSITSIKIKDTWKMIKNHDVGSLFDYDYVSHLFDQERDKENALKAKSQMKYK